jgi:hypothetical protein
MMTSTSARKALNKTNTVTKGTKNVLSALRKNIKLNKNYVAIEGGISKDVSSKLADLGYSVNHYKGSMYTKGKQSTVSF